MCTRYFIAKTDPILVPLIREMERSPLCERFELRTGRAVLPSEEVRPTDIAPVIAPDRNGNRAVFPMQWGYQLPDGKMLFNARSETAGVKAFWKDDWMRHRCIVPASCYFEWNKNPTELEGKPLEPGKYLFQTPGSSVTWLCGLYRIVDGLPRFVVLTKEATGKVMAVHPRMPLILRADQIDQWISPGSEPAELMEYAVRDMVLEKA